ncbi:hypothetical protein SAMN05443550_1162 [Pedobacter hartonius]|uniref:Uncharacterized protein n=1 Tax=Pedobacter hartonius TaxID=425514 RepID=A0A1H4HFI7_9SPHI|nr:hypothetical protein SAMN05443550_1162 [Pedobacter hartonius]
MPRYWYAYVPGANPDPTLPANYILIIIKPTCTTGFIICAILVYVGPGSPPVQLTFISVRLRSYIANALTTTAPQPAAGKYFVYLKN